MNKTEQISIVGCDADMPLLSLMAKKNAPKIAIMGWKAEEMSMKASEMMDKTFLFNSAKEAKSQMGQIHSVKPFFVTNTGEDKVFEPYGAMNPARAWDHVHHNQKRPW